MLNTMCSHGVDLLIRAVVPFPSHCTLAQIATHANVASLVASVQSRPDVQAALSQLGGVDLLQRTFEKDSADVQAAQPKYPIKGQRNILITRWEGCLRDLCSHMSLNQSSQMSQT